MHYYLLHALCMHALLLATFINFLFPMQKRVWKIHFSSVIYFGNNEEKF